MTLASYQTAPLRCKVGTEGIEPSTIWLISRWSTTALHANIAAGKKGNNTPAASVKGKLTGKRSKPFTERYIQDLNLYSISAGLVSNQLRYHYGNVPDAACNGCTLRKAYRLNFTPLFIGDYKMKTHGTWQSSQIGRVGFEPHEV